MLVSHRRGHTGWFAGDLSKLRGPFLRDIGFFTCAMVILLIVLWDSKLQEWEAVNLALLYVPYVIVV